MHPLADPDILIGADLVEFDHRARPIYDTAAGDLTGTAGPSWGAPLDRLFGDGEGLHVENVSGLATIDVATAAADPLVELGNLSDSLGFTDLESAAAIAIEPAPDLGGTVSLHDTGPWDGSAIDWTLDGHS